MKRVKMTLLLASMVMAAFVSNAQEPTVTIEFANAATASEIVQKYVKALQNGDVTTMSAQFAENAMVYGLGGGVDSLNVAQHTEYFTNTTATYKNNITQDLYLPVKVENNWNEGEWVLAWGTNTITDKKTGKNILIPYHTANLVQDGKIVSMRYFYDMLNILENQGFTITPPAE
jgi:ketosteroid isomerase-like protein